MPLKIPDGFNSVMPHLVSSDVAKMIYFLQNAFHATEKEKRVRPDGTVMHAEMKLGDSVLVIDEPNGEQIVQPSLLYHYVIDVDSVFWRSLASGGTSITEPIDEFNGDRRGDVSDPAGNRWQITTRKEELTADEMARRFAERAKEKPVHAAPAAATAFGDGTTAAILAVWRASLTSFRDDAEGALAKLAPIYSEQVRFRDPLQTIEGKDEFIAMNRRLMKRSRELSFDIVDTALTADRILVTWRMRMVPRMGPTLNVDGTSDLRVVDGKVVEHRDYWDLLGSVAASLPIVAPIYKMLVARLG